MTDFKPSIIYTAAAAELDEQIKKELEVEDPSNKQAQANIDNYSEKSNKKEPA